MIHDLAIFVAGLLLGGAAMFYLVTDYWQDSAIDAGVATRSTATNGQGWETKVFRWVQPRTEAIQ